MKPTEENLRQAWHTFRMTDRLHRAAIEKRVGEFGIHRSQHFLLMTVSHEGGCCSQKRLSELLEVSPAAITVTLGKLEAGGYIVRQMSSDDSRINEVSLTPLGREITEKSLECFEEVDGETFDGISAEELEAFTATLRKMQNNLKRAEEPANSK